MVPAQEDLLATLLEDPTVARKGNFLLYVMKWTGERGKQRWTWDVRALGRKDPVGVRSDCSERGWGGQRACSRRGGQLGIKAGPVVGRTKAKTARILTDNDMWGGLKVGGQPGPHSPPGCKHFYI